MFIRQSTFQTFKNGQDNSFFPSCTAVPSTTKDTWQFEMSFYSIKQPLIIKLSA